MRRLVIPLLVLLTAACATAPAATPTAEQAAVQATDVPATDVPATAVPATDIPPTDAPAAQSAMERPAWQTIQLTNARSGETFTLADFAGKTVYVEPMATWCPLCRGQQQRVVSVYNDLGQGGDTLFISLSVGENIGDADLAAYAEREGFGWTFAIASPEMMAALSDAFGRVILSPPSTPHFIIYPDGRVSDLTTGSESSDSLRAALTSA